MMKNNVLGLYDHNLESYKKVKKAFDEGEKIVGIIHATGTGKTLNALQLALDNKDKNIVFFTPYNSIIEHIKEVIGENPDVDIEKDFGHVKFMNYASLVNMTPKELKEMDIDMMILDEFHHIGAPVWGERIETILETHPELLIFGMSAYSIRDRGTAYERDLAEPNSDELFSDKIVSTYDLVDAMLDGVLPVPVYKGAHLELEKMADMLEKRASSKVIKNDDLENILHILHDVKRRVSTSDKVNELLKNNIKPDGKYIYFCPAVSKDGVNDVYSIMDETKKYFLDNGFKEEDLCFYVSTSEETDKGKTSRKCFYNDIDINGNSVDGKLRIMFAINQYNEGVHAPNVDGVILGRETKSDIVFFEQIGRALSVRGDTCEKVKEYQKYSLDEIKAMCKEKGIAINDDMSKDDMIERIVAPVIIDLVGNYTFIRDLVTELKHRMRLYKNLTPNIPRNIEITENAFDVEFSDQDLFEALMKIRDIFVPKSWEESFELAKNYADAYKNLNVNRNFKTDDGVNYDQYGYALGEWITYQRKLFNKGELEQDKIDKLDSIGMVWSYRRSFEEVYEMAKNYYEVNGDLRIPYHFKTLDGVTKNDKGYPLGSWLVQQRRKKKLGILSKERQELLEEIGIEWKVLKTWEESYVYAVLYYKEFGNLDVKKSYVAEDGYPLGNWIYAQKVRYRDGSLSKREISLLNVLKINWEIKKVKKGLTWEENYQLLVNFYNEYKHTNVSRSFKTFDGITEDEDGYNLGMWASRQKVKYKEGKLSPDKIAKLNSISFDWSDKFTPKSWEDAYKLAYNFYQTYHHLNIRTDFKTSDGITEDENGYNLGTWIYLQRKKYNREELDEEKVVLLDKIGMIWDINKNYADIKNLLKQININPRKYATKVKHLSYLEFEAKVNFLLSNGLSIVDDKEVHEIFNMADANLISKYNISRDDLINNYGTLGKRL